jgi:hypothetical protein
MSARALARLFSEPFSVRHAWQSLRHFEPRVRRVRSRADGFALGLKKIHGYGDTPLAARGSWAWVMCSHERRGKGDAAAAPSLPFE